MEIVDQETKDKILKKVARHLNIADYYDIHELSGEEFSNKHGHWGINQQNFLEIRFYPETNVFTQLKKLLPQEEEYFILPIENSRRIYRDKIDVIETIFNDHAKAHVIMADTKFNWILIKDDFNKLIGMGNQIKKKIKKRST